MWCHHGNNNAAEGGKACVIRNNQDFPDCDACNLLDNDGISSLMCSYHVITWRPNTTWKTHENRTLTMMNWLWRWDTSVCVMRSSMMRLTSWAFLLVTVRTIFWDGRQVLLFSVQTLLAALSLNWHETSFVLPPMYLEHNYYIIMVVQLLFSWKDTHTLLKPEFIQPVLG